MDEHRHQLRQYIISQLGAGADPDKIAESLIAAGWQADIVHQAVGECLGMGIGLTSQNQQPQTAQTPETVHTTGAANSTYQPEATHAGQPAEPAGQVRHTATPVQLPADAPHKYRVFRAVGDAIRAIQGNPVSIFVAIVLNLAITLAYVFTAILAIGFLFGLAFSGSHSAGRFFLVVGGIFLLLIVISTVLGALLINVTTLAVNDGAEGRKSHIGSLLKTGFARIKHLWKVYLMVFLVTLGPLLATVFLGLAANFAGGPAKNLLNIIAILGGIFSFIWIIVALLRYSLASIVAVLEPDLGARQTLARSKMLLNHGGQWFIVKGALLLIAVSIILSFVLSAGESAVVSSQGSLVAGNIVESAVGALISLVANGVMVMLYRNRAAVKATLAQ